MELLRNVGHVKSHFGLFGCKIGARFALMYLRHINHFGQTRWYSLVTRLLWKLVLVHLETMLILMQDRCMVCVEHTIGSEIVLDSPNGTPR
jgi:hypothetical protein